MRGTAVAGGYTAWRSGDLVAALRDPAAYAHEVATVQVRETHLSWVFLAGEYAYKVKKPVALGFVDFATVERRAAACAEEVRLNRRLCPDVYLGVVDIVERDGALRVGGPGRPVEPAVRMRRLPEGGMLVAMLAREAAGERHLRRVGTRLAHFHATAATGPGVDRWGRPDVIRTNWDENFAQVAALGPDLLPQSLREAVRALAVRFPIDNGALLARRIAEGRVRDGHGDLHVGNVCFEGRRIQLFDCLEFSARYRCADVAAEVAFLAMDLTAHGRVDLAAAFVAAYVRASGDHELPALLPFYASYRAWVRGKVTALRLDAPDLAQGERLALVEAARGYFTLAWSYATGFAARPLLVVVCGLPASGKTRLARALAGHLGLLHLSSDLVRKELAGSHPLLHRTDSFAEGLYAPRMGRRTYATMRSRAGHALRQGQAVVLDGTYGQLWERAAVRRLAARCGAPLILLECRAEEATLRERLTARERDPLCVSDARLSLWPALRAAYTPPGDREGVTRLDMEGPFGAALARALGCVGVPRGGWII